MVVGCGLGVGLVLEEIFWWGGEVGSLDGEVVEFGCG